MAPASETPRRRRPSTAAGVLFAATLQAACVSGQTGSPDCAPIAPSCPCGALEQSTPVVAEVLDVQGPSVTLRVQDSTLTRPNVAPLPGNLVVGQVWVPERCGDGSGTAVRVGDVVVASLGALELRCGPAPTCDAGGAPDAWAQVPSDALEWRATIVIGTMGSTVDFGDGTELPLGDVVSLTEAGECRERYPGPPEPPCNDVVETSTCAVVSARRGAPGGPFETVPALGAVAAAALALARRSRRKRAATGGG